MAEEANSLPLSSIRRPPLGFEDLSAPKATIARGQDATSAQAESVATSSIVEEAEVLKGSLKAGSVAQIVVAIIATIGLLYLLKFVMVTLFVAILLAFILEPVVQLLSRVAIPRASGALLAVVLAAAFAGGLGYFLYGRVGDFAAELPRYSDRIQQGLTRIQEPLSKLEKSASAITRTSRDGGQAIPVVVQERPIFSRIVTANGGVIGEVLFAIGFIPFLSYFMLTWKDHAHSATVRLFPEEHRQTAYRTVARISAMIRSFIVGNIAVGAIGAAVCTTVFWLLKLPYSYFLGTISGFISLIPSVGVFLALVPPLGGGIGTLNKTGLVIILLTVTGTHAVTMNVLYPKFIGKRVRLNPLAVLLSLLFWAWIWGAVGLVLAVPIVGAAKIVCDYTDSLKGLGIWLGE
jgi:predicted PurR-regulated permease PerM